MTQDAFNRKNSSNKLKNWSIGKWSFFVLFIVLISSSIQCANIQQPTGGPIDSIPPKLLSEHPKNLTTNFTEKKVTIEFDEFIKLSNPNQQISISPEMDRMPTFNAKRKNLEITLPDSLEENTTYVINFGEAIADNNEGNAFLNYSYVFSTGNEIDSLQISGRVMNAFTDEPEPIISVILIPTSQDSTFGKKKANIFATTDSSGNFQLKYLREDTYRIYALKEQNNDRIYNSSTESIGFIADSINLQRDTAGIALWTSIPIESKFSITQRGIEENGRIFFDFNKFLEDPDLRITFPEELQNNKILEVNEAKNGLSLWLEDMTFDSLKVEFLERDSIVDSLILRRPKNDKYNRNILISDNLDRNMVNRTKHMELTANAPVTAIDPSKIELLEDSVKITNYSMVKDSADDRKFILRYNWKKDKNYILNLDEGTFKGHYEAQNQKSGRQFTLDDSNKYGDIILNFTIPDTSIQYIVELIDDNKEKVFKKDIIEKNTALTYRKFLEGRYMLRIIYDTNKNGIWDPGDLDKKTQPEKVWYYDKQFIIRPNWEQEEKISIPTLGK